MNVSDVQLQPRASEMEGNVCPGFGERIFSLLQDWVLPGERSGGTTIRKPPGVGWKPARAATEI